RCTRAPWAIPSEGRVGRSILPKCASLARLGFAIQVTRVSFLDSRTHAAPEGVGKPVRRREDLCLRLQRGAACEAGGVMAWGRGAEGVDVDVAEIARSVKRAARSDDGPLTFRAFP